MRFVKFSFVAIALAVFFLPKIVLATPEEDRDRCILDVQQSIVLAAQSCNMQYPANPQPCIDSIDTSGIDSCHERYNQATRVTEPTPAGTGGAVVEVNQEAGFNNILKDGIIFANMNDGGDCKEKGECSLDQIMQVVVNVTIFILGISGSVVLLMFVYGGFLWVTSQGNAQRVEKGKDTITQAVIGFALILLAYSMINFLIAALAGNAATPGDTLEETIREACQTGTNPKDCELIPGQGN